MPTEKALATLVLLVMPFRRGVAQVPAVRGPAERVELREAVNIGKDILLLSDLLPATAPAALRARSAQITLGKAPRLGSVRVIRGDALKARLNKAQDFSEQLKIPAEMVVSRAQRRVSREEILGTL